MATQVGSNVWPFGDLEPNAYGVVLVDPPWFFKTWSDKGQGRAPTYSTMPATAIAAMPVGKLAAGDSILFMWVTWPSLPAGLRVIKAWGFKFKTCGFVWLKADPGDSPIEPAIGLGYWTRANTEVCLIATRGKPKRIHRGIQQVIVAPRREHSRKPDEIYERIEALVSGPYLELFARHRRENWAAWGNEVAP